ncbi:MAG: ABC transporter ATP-binding protein, partial [Cellulosilyticum sp.]|nr:ABC transporter ATP-binding protein [Cellulosilyticum sp.]
MSKAGGKGPRKPQNMMGTLKRLMGYLGHHKFALLAVFLLIIVSSVSLVAGVSFTAPIINDYILPGNFNGLAKVLAILACIFIAGAVASYSYARIMVRVSQKCMYRIRTELFNKMQTLPIKYFDGHTNGDLMSLYTN